VVKREWYRRPAREAGGRFGGKGTLGEVVGEKKVLGLAELCKTFSFNISGVYPKKYLTEELTGGMRHGKESLKSNPSDFGRWSGFFRCQVGLRVKGGKRWKKDISVCSVRGDFCYQASLGGGGATPGKISGGC